MPWGGPRVAPKATGAVVDSVAQVTADLSGQTERCEHRHRSAKSAEPCLRRLVRRWEDKGWEVTVK